MKLIRVTYRATFQQPKEGPINRMGAKISCPIFIEVYQATKDRWLARSPKIDRWRPSRCARTSPSSLKRN